MMTFRWTMEDDVAIMMLSTGWRILIFSCEFRETERKYDRFYLVVNPTTRVSMTFVFQKENEERNDAERLSLTLTLTLTSKKKMATAMNAYNLGACINTLKST
jgi:hypothetical protein